MGRTAALIYGLVCYVMFLGVHHAVRLDADDRAGRERLAHYMLRCPFSLERLIRVTDHGTAFIEAPHGRPSTLSQ